jgi:DNA invertase Pin-like site-specific DNA recombinase
MASIGYARVSTSGQHLDSQLAALSGCEKVFQEKSAEQKTTAPSFRQCWSGSGKATPCM